jgi:hypothetical protein
MRHLPYLLLIAGCGAMRALNPSEFVGDTGTPTTDEPDADADTDADVDTTDGLEITSVSPAFGTNAGGTEVTILGGPFDADVEITFGGVPVSNYYTVTGDTVVVASPPSGTTGKVDVQARNVGRGTSGTNGGGFQYWQDGTGDYGAYGELGWYTYLGSYWGSPPPSPFFSGLMWFNAPSNDKYWKYLYASQMDSCAVNYPLNVSAAYSPGSPSLTLTTGTKAIDFFQDTTYTWLYFSDPATANGDVVLGGVYDLAPPVGAAPDWPNTSIPGIGQVPSNSPDVSLPAMDGAQPAQVTQGAFTFNWGGPYDGDYVLIQANRARPDASGYYAVVEYVSCVATDDGTFKIPSGTFSAWDTTKDAFYISVGRAIETQGTIPYDNSESGIAGVFWEIGFAVAR